MGVAVEETGFPGKPWRDGVRSLVRGLGEVDSWGG